MHPFLLIALMWVAYFLNYCDRQVVFSLFPVLQSDLGFSDTQLGLTGSIFLWVYAFACPVAGQMGDRFSKRILVVLSLAIWSVVTIATGFSTSALMLLFLRALMGVSESLYMPNAISLTANAYPPALRSRAIATLSTAQVAGTVGGGWFGGWMAEQGRWREAFFCLGVIGVLYAGPYWLLLRRVGKETHVETKAAGKMLAAAALGKIATYRVLCVAFTMFVFGLWLLYGWLPNFLREKFTLGLGDAAFNATFFLQSASLAGLLAGGIIADWLARRTSGARVWILAASLLLCAPCLYGLGHSGLAMTRVAGIAFGFFAGFFMGNIFPAAFEVVPGDTRASAVGVLNFFGSLISGFATLCGGVWKKTLGFEGLTAWTALGYLLAGLLLIAVARRSFQHDYKQVR
ncbi:MAG TPA: MFS transporter [Verrucomicrobiae bacterium]|jgi:MFS family permease|nr:MFS transporter [Verrucomicrobiae bacterium]